MTVGEYLQNWLKTIAPTARKTTFASFEMATRLYLVPTLGHYNLQDLTSAHIRQALARLAEQGKGDRTRQLAHSVLRLALNLAVEDGLIQRNPAALKSLKVRVAKKLHQALTIEQARTFIEAAKQDELALLWLLALYTGAREGELLALHKEDIQGDRVSIRYTLQELGGKILGRVPPKSNNSVRTITIPGELAQVLAVKVANTPSNHPLFALKGAYIHKRTILRRFKSLLTRAGLPDIRFHDLRHSAAALMIASGADAKSVQTILGHSSAAFTLDVYAYAFNSKLVQVTNKMQEVLFD